MAFRLSSDLTNFRYSTDLIRESNNSKLSKECSAGDDYPSSKPADDWVESSGTKSVVDLERLTKSKSPDISVNVKAISRSSTLETTSRSSTWDNAIPNVPPKARRGRKSWIWAFVSQIIGLLWLAPITALLVLNYKKYIVGASIWCPGGNCPTETFNDFEIALKKATELDREDHDIMGALQFVSKALEVWFMFISTSLVYDVAMLLMKKGGGLPVGFLLTHLEFGDIRYLFNPLLWTSPIPHPSRKPGRRTTTLRLYLFVGLTASLTILTNLMGPATAVLMLPTLQWIDTPHVPHIVFHDDDAASGPITLEMFPRCSLEDYDKLKLSCTMETHGANLDAYAEATNSVIRQYKNNYGDQYWIEPTPILSQEGIIQFSLNTTVKGGILWAPNRQVIRDLSHDSWSVLNAVNPYSDEPARDAEASRYNNSLQTLVQRNGVSFGVTTECFVGNRTVIPMGEDKEVVCFDGWTAQPDSPHFYNKCIQHGRGWSNVHFSAFALDGSEPGSRPATVSNYFSRHATFYNDTTDFGTNIKRCAQANTCDKEEKIFAAELPPALQNQTKNTLITEYKVPYPSTPDVRLWCDSHVYFSFPTYTFDTSSVSNPIHVMNLNNLKNIGPEDQPRAISTAWILAAWSVDDGGTVAGNRSIAKQMLKVLPGPFDDVSSAKLNFDRVEFGQLHQQTLGQAMSLISFVYDMADNLGDRSVHPGPVFYRYSTLHVWAYGFSDNTSKLGVAVAFLGAACVIIRLFLAASYRFRHELSSVEMLATALNHKSQGEFEGMTDERALARVRLKMTKDDFGQPMFAQARRFSR